MTRTLFVKRRKQMTGSIVPYGIVWLRVSEPVPANIEDWHGKVKVKNGDTACLEIPTDAVTLMVMGGTKALGFCTCTIPAGTGVVNAEVYMGMGAVKGKMKIDLDVGN